MRFRCALLSVGLALGCGTPQPALTGVEPTQAGSDKDAYLTLFGRDFIPATILDPLSGQRIATSDGFDARIGRSGQWTRLEGLTWLSTGALGVTLPSNTARLLPTGPLDIEVLDPRDQRAVLSGGFFELGADTVSPSIVFTSPSPDTPFAPGRTLRGGLHASKPAPGALRELGWRYEEDDEERDSARCYVAPGANAVDCAFQVTIGTGLGAGDNVAIVAYAADTSGNRAEARLVITLRARPTLVSLSPDLGGTAGGTDIVIVGSGFLPGSQATLDGELLFPNGGIVIDENTISGHTPAHPAGPAALAVRTPAGDTVEPLRFTYQAPPGIAAITPNAGAAAGATTVIVRGTGFSASTRIYFGQSLDSAVPLVEPFLQDESSIVGHTPPGSGQTTVWAVDGSLGFTKLQGGFTWRSP